MHARQVEPDEAPGHRYHHAGQVDLRVKDHVELDFGDAVERGQTLAQLHRRALDVGKHVGQPVVTVKRVARALERFVHREHANEPGHTNRHHQRNGERLRAQPGQVAPELDVQGVHGFTSSGWTPPPCAH